MTERAQEILDLAGVIILALDREGKVTLVNRAGCRILGGSEPDILGRDWFDTFIADDQRDDVRSVFNSLMAGEIEPVEFYENQIVTLEGRPRLIAWRNTVLTDVDRRISGTLSAGEDVTERARVEDALRRSENDYRDLLDQLPDGIGVNRDGKFIHVNKALLDILGYEDPEELAGQSWSVIVQSGGAGKAADQFQNILDHGGRSRFEEVECVKKDGSLVTLEVAALRVNFDGKPAVVGIARDVSLRKELTARMMKMDRMITIGTLAAGVGHEINNPLTYVIENVKFAIEKLEAKRDTEGVDEILESLEEARQGARRVGLVVQDLKTFSRADEDSRKTILLEDLIESATSMAWNELRHRAQLIKDLAPGLYVTANRARLGQVFLNLLLNAAHSIEEGRAERNSIRVRSMPRDEHVLIEFEDTGMGIPPLVRERIFEPFYTTKPIGQGTGLGLSICREIVDAHGGELLLQSEVGRGSTFTVVLPLAEPAAEDDPEPSRPIQPIEVEARGRILVVDDEPMICSLVSRALGKEHEVIAETDARRAVDLFKSGDRFDIIFCDLMMPEMTGMDLHAEVDLISPAQSERIVFLTGGAFTPRAREFLDSVENRRMDKPFDVRALRLIVEAMLK